MTLSALTGGAYLAGGCDLSHGDTKYIHASTMFLWRAPKVDWSDKQGKCEKAMVQVMGGMQEIECGKMARGMKGRVIALRSGLFVLLVVLFSLAPAPRGLNLSAGQDIPTLDRSAEAAHALAAKQTQALASRR